MMNARLPLPALLVTLLAVWTSHLRAEDADPGLEAGFAAVSLVTQQKAISLAGYGGRGLLPSRGVHDATMAKVCVLRSGSETIALVTTDLIGVQHTMYDALVERGLPEGINLDPRRIVITASHTHAGYGNLATRTGGASLDMLFLATCGPLRKAFFDEVLGKLRTTIAEAYADLKPAKLGVISEAIEGLCHNRGGVKVTDPEVGVIVITDRNDALRGVIANFSAHPTLLGANNFFLSAGWPGAFQRAFEAEHPGVTAMFSNGAEGDVSVSSPPGQYADEWEKVEATGRRFAGHVARLAKSGKTRADLRVWAQVERIEMLTPSAGEFQRKSRGAPRASLFSQVILGDTLLLGIPGEPCSQIGLDLKARGKKAGFAHTFILGLANDHLGYFVHASNYEPESAKSHDYEKSLNFFGPEVGAFFEDVHFNRFRPAPLTRNDAQPDFHPSESREAPARTPAPGEEF